MIRKIKVSALAFVLALAGCKNEAPQTQMAKSYDLMTVKSGEFTTSASYSASVKGKKDIEIYPQVGGYLRGISVSEGENVKKGQLLFTIEQAPYLAAYNAAEAGVQAAEASVATAQLSYDNAVGLNKKKIISDSELKATKNALEGAKAQLASAKAQVMSAKTNLDFTKITSPSDGVVGKLPYRQGALVSSALPQSLTVVSENSEMYVYFSMTEAQAINLIQTYGSLEKAVEGLPELQLQLSNGSLYPCKGKLESISGVLDSATGTVSLRAVFPNKDRLLLSGGTATVVMPQTLENVIVIPKAATFDLQDKIFVYAVVDGKTKALPIKVAKIMSSTEYVVSSGLQGGEVIISSGAGLLREGTPVKQ